MSKTLRVVKTCYDYGYSLPSVRYLGNGQKYRFDSFDEAYDCMRTDVQREMNTLNNCQVPDIENCDEFNFRSDFDSDHAAIIRFWDGDDYRIVIKYDIYPVNRLSPSKVEYRGFEVEEDQELDRFKVTVNNISHCCNDMDLAFLYIDTKLIDAEK